MEFKLNVLNVDLFAEFLSKFETLDNNLLLEFESNDIIKAKVFNAAQSAVKFATINFKDIFEIKNNEKLPSNLRFYIFNIKRLIQILKSISEEEINIFVKYEKYDQQKDVFYIDSFILLTKNLKLSVPKGKETAFTYLSDEMINKMFDTSNSYFESGISKELIDKITLYSNLDLSKSVTISPKITKDKKELVVFSGNSFDLKSDGESKIKEEVNISIDKTFFKYLDKGNYNLFGKINKTKDGQEVKTLVFISEDNNFKVLMASKKPEDGE